MSLRGDEDSVLYISGDSFLTRFVSFTFELSLQPSADNWRDNVGTMCVMVQSTTCDTVTEWIQCHCIYMRVCVHLCPPPNNKQARVTKIWHTA